MLEILSTKNQTCKLKWCSLKDRITDYNGNLLRLSLLFLLTFLKRKDLKTKNLLQYIYLARPKLNILCRITYRGILWLLKETINAYAKAWTTTKCNLTFVFGASATEQCKTFSCSFGENICVSKIFYWFFHLILMSATQKPV